MITLWLENGDKKLKILMIDKYFFVKGGAERYFFELKDILVSNGHKVVPFAMKHPQNLDSPYSDYFLDYIDFNPTRLLDKITTGVRSAGRIIYSVQAKRRIGRLIQKTKPDIAHLHMIDHQISPSILSVLKKAGIPIVQTVHTYKAVCPSYRLFSMHKKQICEKCLHGAFYHAVFERCHKQSLISSALLFVETSLHHALQLYSKYIDLFIVPSAFMGQKMVEGGYPSARIQHLPHAINIKDYPIRYDSNGYFVFNGRLSEEKGIATLIRAMQDVEQFMLKIIGDGPERAELEKLAHDLKLKNVIFTGSLNGPALQKEILGAKFVVVPSEWYENAPMVIYEAFAMGKPVVGSRIGGIPELIEHGKDGFLFEPGDANELRKTILAFFENPELASQMGYHARQKAEKMFSPQVHYERLMWIYTQAKVRRQNNEQGS